MKNIRDIMKIVGCDDATARRIFDQMAIAGLDFSEATKAEFKRAALAASTRLAEASNLLTLLEWADR